MRVNVKKFILMFLLGFTVNSYADDSRDQVATTGDKTILENMVKTYFDQETLLDTEEEYKARLAVRYLMCSVVINYNKDKTESSNFYIKGMDYLDDFAIKLANDQGDNFFTYKNMNTIVKTIPRLSIDYRVKDKDMIKGMFFQSISWVFWDEAWPYFGENRMKADAKFKKFYKEKCKPLA
ncbi:hypothetical protein F945_01941 [Acinetobacter rudis CIP 110305]|uniref:Uncharacterized protein n=1 Tax=Acinetobacter rudis CIP 110305 TaxID=421052 RepID=S3N232_9GAMM|nr:hypothetical protein F945_01941 [Acinetobacter rudis CIP 110305]